MNIHSHEISGPTHLSEFDKKLDFLWLELTNRCNLKCSHCYTESDPYSGSKDVLTTNDYLSIINQAYLCGCSKLQFIGGEPQLNRNILFFAKTAKNIGFDFIEIYTNLTKLSDTLLQGACDVGVCFATTVFSDQPCQHDEITGVKGSHLRTINNLKKLIDSKIPVRVSIIDVKNNKEMTGKAKDFVNDLGVSDVRIGHVAEFGRGQDILSKEANIGGLCGHCWKGNLCIAPDGFAYSCVMARSWPVGNVLESSLSEIVNGASLSAVRERIFNENWLLKLSNSGRCEPDCPQSCTPGRPCTPTVDCPPSCSPHLECEKSCNPKVICVPNGRL